MKKLIETAGWTAFWLSWVFAFLFGYMAFGLTIALAAALLIVRLAMADEPDLRDDCGYRETPFGIQDAEWDRIVANGGIE